MKKQSQRIPKQTSLEIYLKFLSETLNLLLTKLQQGVKSAKNIIMTLLFFSLSSTFGVSQLGTFRYLRSSAAHTKTSISTQPDSQKDTDCCSIVNTLYDRSKLIQPSTFSKEIYTKHQVTLIHCLRLIEHRFSNKSRDTTTLTALTDFKT